MNGFDYVVGLILLVLIVLAIRAAFFSKNKGNSGCANCPYSKDCNKKTKDCNEE